MQLSRSTALLSAFLLSFSVHLIPLLHAHAGWMPMGLFFAGAGELSAFSLAMAAAALAIQLLAFGLFYWLLRRPNWLKVVAVVAAVPLIVAAANWSLLFAIPYLVLVESDVKPERGTLERVCSLADATIAQVHAGTDLSLVRAGEVWLIVTPDGTRARLTMPGCRTAGVSAPKVGSTMDSAAPGGFLLYRDGGGRLVYVAPGVEEARAVAAPPGSTYWSPILSDDGMVVAWLDREPAQGRPGPYRLRLRHLADGREEAISLDLPRDGQFDLIGAASRSGPFTLAQYRNRIVRVGISGERIAGPISPPGVDNARWGFRWLDGGWVAWDGYREEGRARLVWELPAGRGTITIPRGRGIDSLSIAEDGSAIAASVSSNLSLGSVKSAVFLVRTDDGREIYRRYLPTYARTRLAFLGSSYLAMSRAENGRSSVDVYRMPMPDGGGSE